MNPKPQFVAALFGAGCRAHGLSAPGDADSRWRAVAPEQEEAEVARLAPMHGLLRALRGCLDRLAART